MNQQTATGEYSSQALGVHLGLDNIVVLGGLEDVAILESDIPYVTNQQAFRTTFDTPGRNTSADEDLT